MKLEWPAHTSVSSSALPSKLCRQRAGSMPTPPTQPTCPQLSSGTHQCGVLGQLLLRNRHAQLVLDGQLQCRQVGVAVHLYALQAIPERRAAAGSRSAAARGGGGATRQRRSRGAHLDLNRTIMAALPPRAGLTCKQSAAQSRAELSVAVRRLRPAAGSDLRIA